MQSKVMMLTSAIKKIDNFFNMQSKENRRSIVGIPYQSHVNRITCEIQKNVVIGTLFPKLLRYIVQHASKLAKIFSRSAISSFHFYCCAARILIRQRPANGLNKKKNTFFPRINF